MSSRALLHYLLAGLSSAEKKYLKRVYDFGCDHLQAVQRRSSESYAQHGLEVASTLKEVTGDQDMLAAALLHDLQVHPDGEELIRMAPITKDIQHLIEDMHALRRLHIDARTDDLDTVLDAFLEDQRLLPMRMAHRVNDVRHLRRFRKPMRKQVAEETLHMYSAIAGRLGMHVWRYEMQDTCFKEVQPRIALALEKKFQEVRQVDMACLEHAQKFLKRQLQKHGIKAKMDHRLKSLYSTYRKMIIKHRTFEEMTDRLALRVIVEDEMDCYRALAVVHSCMHPIPGKLKDYIGAPKENGYKSIHTVVYPLPGVTEEPMEIQIRTDGMNTLCEYGSLSHGEYKNQMYALTARPARVNLFRNLRMIREEASSPKQFEKALLQYFREDHIPIFDPQNNLFHLHKPATALDFVSIAHPKRFMLLKSVRVNGRNASFDTPLHDGDTVEAQFGKQKRIAKDWLKFCSHRSTRSTIKQALQNV